MACTTLLVGKGASYDGSTIVTRSEDSPSGIFTAKRFIVVHPEEQPRHYRSVISECEVELPDNPMRYTCLPSNDPKDGIWGAAGINEANVSMTATETITTNPRVQGIDPILKNDPNGHKEGGIGEEDFVTLVLPYIHSARDGVIRLGQLLEEHGTYEMNGIAFQDVDEIWWLETIGGHHWMARRVPDDAYVVMPNQLGIDYFDFEDAYGEQKDFMCSKDLQALTEQYHLDLSNDSEAGFNPRLAYGSKSDSDHIYNTPRAWAMLRHFNPHTYVWDGPDAEYTPEDDDLPWAMVPEFKITVEDMKYILSHHYQGTPYDCYGKWGEADRRGMYRPIGISRQNVTAFTQIRPYLPEAIRSVQWLSFGSNAFNAVVPYYTNVNTTPDYLADDSTLPTTDNFYWANRLIAALSDAHYHTTQIHIERYQDTVQNKGQQILAEFDAKYMAGDYDAKATQALLEEANEVMTSFLKEQTDQVLAKVLHTASCQMKNGYARSDN